MRIGVAGCSHSGGGYGKPWSHFMARELNCEICDVSASGVGNEMMIEKIKKSFDSPKNEFNSDFYVFQLTDPSRLVLGLYGNDLEKEYNKKFGNLLFNKDNINCHRSTNDVSYYTFRYGTNDEELNELINGNYKVNEFIRNHVLISDFNMKIKIFHTIMAINQLFNFYKKKVLFFSWFVDIVELSKQVGYGEIMSKINIIDGCVLDFINKKNLKTLPNDSHYGTEEHEIIYKEFLHNKILDFINREIK